ncbi:MAG: nucleotide pyrophosphohydrolase [Candidatus Kariarchaeaceae archaeon]
MTLRTFKQVMEKITQFRDERDWKKYHHPHNLAQSIVIEAAELLEEFQWKSEEEANKYANSKEGKKTISHEIADCLIYLLSMCDILELDPEEIISEKLILNEQKYPKKTIKLS